MRQEQGLTNKLHITVPPQCTGCGLCANVCPQNAIKMVWSADGFPVPEVNSEICINCGLCLKQCIAQDKKTPHDSLESVESYAAWNQDSELHSVSSSGGVFSALAAHIFSMGGCVFGVVWQDKETAAFAKAENMSELAAMRGSKYTPALSGYVYREVRKELKSGRYVLFTGTPCQVHALKTFLKIEYERLMTMDIACHGVPSRLILQKYVQEAEKQAGCELAQITFRDKSTGWASGSYSLIHHFVNGCTTSQKQGNDIFMRMFLCDAALNLSCYNCPYAHSPRQGDISVGDYWGVEKYHADWPLTAGVSTLIVNTEQGRRMLAKLHDYLHIHPENFSHICECNSNVYAKPECVVHRNRPYVMAKLRHKQACLQDALTEAVEYSFIGNTRIRNDNTLLRLLRFSSRAARYILRYCRWK